MLRSPPATVIAVFFGLLLAKHSLGLDLSRLSSLTTEGLTFATKGDLEKTNQAIQDSKTTLKNKFLETADALTQVQALDQRLSKVEGRKRGKPGPETPAEEADLTSSVEVPEAIAKLGTLDSGSKPSAAPATEGYIWTGMLDSSTGKLTSQKVAGLRDLNNIEPGQGVTALANLVVRQALPSEADPSNSSSKLVGIVRQGATVTIEEKPKALKRGTRVFYWMKIKVNP